MAMRYERKTSATRKRQWKKTEQLKGKMSYSEQRASQTMSMRAAQVKHGSKNVKSTNKARLKRNRRGGEEWEMCGL